MGGVADPRTVGLLYRKSTYNSGGVQVFIIQSMETGSHVVHEFQGEPHDDDGTRRFGQIKMPTLLRHVLFPRAQRNDVFLAADYHRFAFFKIESRCPELDTAMRQLNPPPHIVFQMKTRDTAIQSHGTRRLYLNI